MAERVATTVEGAPAQGAKSDCCCPLCGAALTQDAALSFDLETGFIIDGRKAVILTEREAELFQLLWDRMGNLVRTDALYDRLYQLSQDEPEIKIIDVYVCKIRAKLRDTQLSIRTHRGRGYSLHLVENSAEETK